MYINRHLTLTNVNIDQEIDVGTLLLHDTTTVNGFGLNILRPLPHLTPYGGTITLVPPYMASIYGPMTSCFVPSLRSWLWQGTKLNHVTSGCQQQNPTGFNGPGARAEVTSRGVSWRRDDITRHPPLWLAAGARWGGPCLLTRRSPWGPYPAMDAKCGNC